MRGQPGFLDVEDRLTRVSDLGDQLEGFARGVDFEMFRPELEAVLDYSDRTKGGRPQFDPVLMFKILVIQAHIQRRRPIVQEIGRMSESRFAIVEAPSVLGTSLVFPKGVETLPDALLAAGLAEKLGASRAGRVEPPPYDDRRDPETRLLNGDGIAAYSTTLADALGSVMDAGGCPVVLGGDCSIMLGCLLALKRRARYGLLFADGHADFYQPEVQPYGEVAAMELALATGRGPAIVTDLEGRGPLVRDEDVVVFARRDAERAAEHGSQRVEYTAIKVMDLYQVRKRGLDRAASDAIKALCKDGIDGFWLHLDADVLNDAIMPAVDDRQMDGLSWDELVTMLRTTMDSGRVVGLNITIFNPKLDTGGSIASAFVDALSRGLNFRGD